MPLIPETLELQILAAFQRMTNSETSMETAQKDLARDLATAIDSYIKTATVIVPPGQAVTTAGTAVAQSGATIAPSAPAAIS
jgi:hypothetical protein